MDREYYVYAYYDEDGIPFYIGMGKGDRITQHLYKYKDKSKKHLLFYRKLNKLISNDICFTYKILRNNISKHEALIVEQVLIELIGRRDLSRGPLTNLTNGGEGSVGVVVKSQKIAIYDIYTLKLVKVFKSITLASRFLGVNESTVRIAESKHNKTGLPNKYYVDRYLNTPSNTFKYIKPKRRFDYYNKPVIVTNVVDNSRTRFNKVNDCADYFLVNRKTIGYRINNKVIVNNFKFEYDK